MENIAQALAEIVGKPYVSGQAEERYFYGRDPGLMPAHQPDYVVLPRSVEEVQAIVKFAGRENVPLVPMGAGMSLSGLVIPQKGGIVVDMKRMDRILKVNETARYAVVEGGTSTGALHAHLNRYYPAQVQHTGFTRCRHGCRQCHDPWAGTLDPAAWIQLRHGFRSGGRPSFGRTVPDRFLRPFRRLVFQGASSAGSLRPVPRLVRGDGDSYQSGYKTVPA